MKQIAADKTPFRITGIKKVDAHGGARGGDGCPSPSGNGMDKPPC